MAPCDFNKGRRPYSFLLLVTTPSLGSSCSDALAVESCTPATSVFFPLPFFLSTETQDTLTRAHIGRD